MRAAHTHKVKRVVITSSVVAIHLSRDPKKKHFTVDDWTDLSLANAYDKSKTIAEKAAWDYLESLNPKDKFELVSINPGLIFGPNLIKN